MRLASGHLTFGRLRFWLRRFRVAAGDRALEANGLDSVPPAAALADVRLLDPLDARRCGAARRAWPAHAHQRRREVAPHLVAARRGGRLDAHAGLRVGLCSLAEVAASSAGARLTTAAGCRPCASVRPVSPYGAAHLWSSRGRAEALANSGEKLASLGPPPVENMSSSRASMSSLLAARGLVVAAAWAD